MPKRDNKSFLKLRACRLMLFEGKLDKIQTDFDCHLRHIFDFTTLILSQSLTEPKSRLFAAVRSE